MPAGSSGSSRIVAAPNATGTPRSVHSSVRGQRRLAAKPGDRQRQVVERRAVMVVGVVGVLAALEQRAELDRLVGLVVVHRPDVEAGQPQRETGRQRDGDDDRAAAPSPAGGGGAHFGEP